MLLPAAGIYKSDFSKLCALRAELCKWQQVMAYGADTRLAIVSRREESLALAVMDALLDAKYVEHAGLVKAERSMARALEVIHSSDLENISAAALCVHAQCSQRLLEKSFLKRFGVTPKRYVKCLRLARVRSDLLEFSNQNCESIIELAGIHGFWHMGQFAADYRAIYGELPSKTLRRN